MNKDFKRGPSKTRPSAPTSSPSKKALSPRDRAIMAEKKRIADQKRKKEIKAFMDKAIATMVFALIGALLALAVIFGYIFFDFSGKSKTPDDNIHLVLPNSDPVLLNEGEYFYRDGEYFVSLTHICKTGPFTLYGNIEKITLSLSENNYATFNVGSDVVNLCGSNSIMSNPCYFENGQFFVPMNFFTQFCTGIKCEFSEKGENESFNLIFDDDISFKSVTSSSLPKIYTNPESSDDDIHNNGFKSNLSSYEMYMNPENKDDFLVIASKNNSLGSDYVPQNLTDISFTKNDGREKQQLDFFAAKALDAMFIEMRANGFDDVYVAQGYRSYDYYKELLENKTKELTPVYGDLASEYALLEVPYPGTDEHQTGLCADIHNMDVENEKFAGEASYKWLYSNCARFGFILRYPKDKTDITGKDFSPWHFRFVGRYHAEKIMSQGLCLEEYLKTL